MVRPEDRRYLTSQGTTSESANDNQIDAEIDKQINASTAKRIAIAQFMAHLNQCNMGLESAPIPDPTARAAHSQ